MSEDKSVNDKTQEEIRIDELNLSEASVFVHLFTRSCTILGYAMNLTLCLAIFNKIISLIDFTDSKYNNGLPKINLWKTSILPFLCVISCNMYVLYNNNLYQIIGSGLKRKSPSLLFHYLHYLAISSVITVTILVIFTFAMENGVDQAACENIQNILCMTVIVIFLVLNASYVYKVRERYKIKSNQVAEEPQSSVINVSNNNNKLLSVAKSLSIVILIIW